MNLEELKANEERYRRIVDDFTGFIVRWQPGGKRTFVSDSYCSYFGISKDEASASDFMELIVPEDRFIVQSKIASLTPTAPVATLEHRVMLPDGTVRWMEWIDRAIFDEHGILKEYQSIGFDIEERRQASEELRRAKSAAEAAAVAKSRLIATMSHEFRTPLTSVVGFVDLLAQSKLSEQQRRYAERIKAGSDALTALVDLLLNVALYEKGGIRREVTRFDFADVATNVIKEMQSKADNKAIQLQVSGESSLVNSDIGLVQQILRCLVDNGIKFSDHGEVIIEYDFDGADFVFSVADNGIGIASALHEKIFEAFFQADMSSTRKYEGAGLGLHLVKVIVEALGGAVAVHSQPERGTKFTVRLPNAA